VDYKKNITERLALLGHDRKWLAQHSGYSYLSVRDCLAPAGKKLSTRMLTAFLAVIERKEAENAAAQALTSPTTDTGNTADPLPDRITLEIDSQRHDQWAAAAASTGKPLKPWAIAELDKAAEVWHLEKQENPPHLKVAENSQHYPRPSNGTSGAP
jgi:hypothetical protein